jgi:hypothetical protein
MVAAGRFDAHAMAAKVAAVQSHANSREKCMGIVLDGITTIGLLNVEASCERSCCLRKQHSQTQRNRVL